jgi:hypothetical protein
MFGCLLSTVIYTIVSEYPFHFILDGGCSNLHPCLQHCTYISFDLILLTSRGAPECFKVHSPAVWRIICPFSFVLHKRASINVITGLEKNGPSCLLGNLDNSIKQPLKIVQLKHYKYVMTANVHETVLRIIQRCKFKQNAENI